MNEIKYGIASYHRPECKTYKFLKNIGIADDNILISLNDTSEYLQYKQHNPTANIIARHGNSAAFNRNTLIETIGKQCILLDDDIINIRQLIEGKTSKYGYLKILSANDLNLLMEQCFETAKRNGARVFGTSAVDNKMTMRKRLNTWGDYTPDVLIQGTITGIVDSSIRFSEKYFMLEDYELTCRIIASGGHTIRRNDLVAIKPKNGENLGGAARKICKWRTSALDKVTVRSI